MTLHNRLLQTRGCATTNFDKLSRFICLFSYVYIEGKIGADGETEEHFSDFWCFDVTSKHSFLT